jgi:hypothetical protein
MRCIGPIRLRSGALVPCGRCTFCRATRANEWSFRIREEMKVSRTAHFITLTYEEEKVPIAVVGNTPVCLTLHYKDLQDFIQRLRRHVGRKGIFKVLAPSESLLEARRNARVRYFAVGEYGTRTFRPHYHGIFFNVDPYTIERIAQVWQLGLCHVGTVTDASINYVTRYMLTADYQHLHENAVKPRALMSKNPGLGTTYAKSHKDYHKRLKKHMVHVGNGVEIPMPRLLSEKVFTRIERDQNIAENERRQLFDYWKNYSELKEKGVQDPDEYMYQSALQKDEIVRRKSKNKGKF